MQSKVQNRRQFLNKSAITGATALAGFNILRNGYGANKDTLRVGVIGVGGRGSGAIRDVLTIEQNVEVVALADVNKENLEERVAALKTHKERGKALTGFNVTPDRCYFGLDGYKEIVTAPDIDIVFLATPPGFRPEHMEAAVANGKHAFSEKPVGVDPVGVRRYMAAAKKAKQKGLGVLAGTQRHHQTAYLETIKRIRDGQIGDVMTAHVYWNGGSIWYRERKPWMTELDYWLYNWYHVDFLSGDHICEQHIHNLDVANWIMEDHPVKAYGMGGRQFHTDRGGNIYDHFGIEYEYGDGRRVTSMCRQIADTDRKVGEDIIGTKGQAILARGEITGAKPWKFKNPKSALTSKQQEHFDFLQSLRNGQPLNEGEMVANSTMTAVMGREAVYTGKVVTWDDMMNSDLNLMPNNLKTWDGSLHPVPKPGQKRGAF
jgi:myo-inositol 2-dehydrogenase / D-chiro-inositol 1-dehydrogenase